MAAFAKVAMQIFSDASLNYCTDKQLFCVKALNDADGNNLQWRMEMYNQPQSAERITSKEN